MTRHITLHAIRPLLIAVVLVTGLTRPASAETGSNDAWASGNRSFVGSWTVLATPGPGGPSPFAGLLVLNADGTLVESNAALHPSSANPALPFNASDGYGTWQRGRRGHQIAITFYKLLFDSAGTHVGHLRVTGYFTRNGQTTETFSGETVVEIIFGSDPFAGPSQKLPNTRVEGRRLGVILPSLAQ